MNLRPLHRILRNTAVIVAAFAIGAGAASASEEDPHKKQGSGIGIGGIIIDIVPLLTRPKAKTPTCRSPAVYSKTTGGCVVPKPKVTSCRSPAVYSKTSGKCVVPPPKVKTVSCSFPLVKSGSVCVCAKGYASSKGKCYKPEPKQPQVVTKTPPVLIDVDRIQECLTRLGYDPGIVDGKQGRKTRDAWREYQEASGLEARPASLSDKETQDHLYEACEAPPTRVAALPDTPVQVGQAPISTPAPTRCLPPDLHDMLRSAYGREPGIEACRPDNGICIPRPVFYSEAKLASVSEREGVRWCDSCVSLNAWMPLATILQIEASAGITLCAAPPALCYLPGRPVVQTQTEVRTIYKALPVSVGNEGDIAVVIGNETYEHGLTPNVYGNADAEAMVKLLTEQLGYREENIIDLRNAKLADFERVFGTAENPIGELAQGIGKEEPGDVVIYISSHGMATEEGVGYLLPVDVRTEQLPTTAYPLQRLYANLGKAGARTTMLMLEATFGQTVTDTIDAPNIPELEVLAMPETPVPGLAVFTAADRDQHALEDPEYGIGLFTRYLISGLAGEADVSPIGNDDKQIDTVELFVYASDMVRTTARKSFGLEQKPLLSRIDNLLVGKLASAE
jgi:hypothetical protein